MGDAIRGKKIVYHRKPFPNLISLGSTLDEDALLTHLQKTLKAAQGCPLEVTYRDIIALQGNPGRLTRAVQLTREAFDRWYV